MSRGRLQPFRPWPYDLDDEPKEDSFLNGSRYCGAEGRNTCDGCLPVGDRALSVPAHDRDHEGDCSEFTTRRNSAPRHFA